MRVVVDEPSLGIRRVDRQPAESAPSHREHRARIGRHDGRAAPRPDVDRTMPAFPAVAQVVESVGNVGRIHSLHGHHELPAPQRGFDPGVPTERPARHEGTNAERRHDEPAPRRRHDEAVLRRRSRSRSSTRRILPDTVFGRLSTNSTARGYLYGAVTRFTWSWSSFASASLAACPARSTTNALTIS